ncbi:G2/mitotic-specific cyclin-B3-like [Clarias gariepinus]|uniref:G2/mitotic-specific cyclin-B3-like n=1 Tax=Clarias gariepinus TaxID=13013 RepID=UPI00234CECEB|nr:G2/mitotic-specific cyclin-B3-like [Clarias gariepinus]XP_053346797.1 G2/mitotic-specific cyclin-B3-like [Clarias gariepinus]XP_053346798.1 G2/mitotic-specific cyclin-B3-like [Clarias gariepinus]
MPFPARRSTHCCGSKAQDTGSENQEDVPHVKRTPSSPQGAPRKRSAFVDITNNKNLQNVRKSQPLKKTQTSRVFIKTNNKLKVSKHPSPEEQCRDPEDQTEESTSSYAGVSPPPQEPPAVQELKVPEEFDVDKEHAGDCLMSPEYAKDIFDYLREREEKFVLTDYTHTQPDLTAGMRGILIDWMVEVQENFELNHETLYLAVKLTDHYLSVTEVMRESLQLIGSTAMLIAAKFEERRPPSIDDFLYICDDAYQRQEFLVMERNILQGLDFDINVPVPYRFLRRYAKVARASMETLTLARYVCELSLLELELVEERASRLASACLLLALITNCLGGWTPALQYHSGYTLGELGPLVRRLYAMLASPSDRNLRAVENKYSHTVFFEVAKMPLVHIEALEEALRDPHCPRP